MLICSSVLVFLLGWLMLWPILQPLPPVETPDIVVKKPDPVYYSTLTGKKVKDEAMTTWPTAAIMIENSPDARPQSGLKQAGVVYEAIAEGGITRFLALYQEDKPTLIGPVRSLRPYFVDWLTPYNASVVHVGGSSAALKRIRNGEYRDIDQFFNASTYWRSTDRYAPHNVYTNFNRIDALNKAKKYTNSTFTGFDRVDGESAEKPTATTITINFSSNLFNTQYKYNAKKNNYERYLAGEKHIDREKGAIAPDAVIAMKVNQKIVMEDGYRESIETIGTGEAIIFQNGTATKAAWSKPSRKDSITFKNKEGKSIPLVRGQTWIAAVPNGQGSITW